jgi:hypothetical protein
MKKIMSKEVLLAYIQILTKNSFFTLTLVTLNSKEDRSPSTVENSSLSKLGIPLLSENFSE